jgi:hypothetical protein
MATLYVQRFTVEPVKRPNTTTLGPHYGLPFPLDMLRYDACFPDTQEDVTSIGSSIEGHEHRSVTLRRYVTDKNQSPTGGRCQPFGWRIRTTPLSGNRECVETHKIS